MKSLIHVVVAACALSAATLAFAQASNGPVTRAEVRADLVQVEQAGYQPAGNQTEFPQNVQAADAQVAAQQNSTTAAVGGIAATGSSAWGRRALPVSIASGNEEASVYQHH
ncbi:DUF4148 domain-containing protein [Paraburkholderia rhizosphaerae]|uniref:Uncharacterized protein DUF4148 n=1 Tax=Paraburkholderia rhizosphaerae TaxID=480658 RepID=A0A4R8LUR6_9BURK|nr:DUF4148 domain-containing protein [Paraburkholderia rhizosphaerae]TDY51533.1 uncharacterized protein DUF4148 [Paraburkholderia rhizosphaerae]